MITLRENQVSPVQVCVDFFKQENPQPSIAVLPTAWGKSILIAKVVESLTDGVVVLSPSKELLEQNFLKYHMLGGKATIYSASMGSKRLSNCVFATIGSIKNIGKRFKEMGIKKMIIDEIHLFPRNSDSMLGQFLKDSEIKTVLGVTATPIKLQSNMDQYGRPYSKLVMLTANSKKGKFFKEIIAVSQIQEIVKLGYWAKLEYEQYLIDETGLKYNSTMADFTDESMKKVYESNDIHGKIIQKLQDLPNRKSIIVFVPGVEQAITLARQVPGSVAVYGDMPSKDRTRALTAFKNGSIRVAFNCNVLSCGFDHPQLDSIIMARPTASLAWYYQALGRATRIHPDKKDALIVDFSGNIKKFGRIEHLHYEKEGNLWKLYGEHDNLLSGIPLHQIGMYKKTPQPIKQQIAASGDLVWPYGKVHGGKLVSQLPREYREWVLREFNFNESNMKFKEALEKLR